MKNMLETGKKANMSQDGRQDRTPYPRATNDTSPERHALPIRCSDPLNRTELNGTPPLPELQQPERRDLLVLSTVTGWRSY